MTRDKLINWLTRRTADESQLEAADMLQRDGKELERLRAELAECRAKHMDDLLVLGETAKAERELRAELAECKRDMDADDLPDCRMCRFFRCDDIGPFCLEEDERICTDGDLFAGRFMPTQPVRLYEVNNAPALAAKGEE